MQVFLFFLFFVRKTFHQINLNFQGVALAIQTTKKVVAVVDRGYGKKESKQTNGDRDVGDTLVDDQPLKNTKEVLE